MVGSVRHAWAWMNMNQFIICPMLCYDNLSSGSSYSTFTAHTSLRRNFHFQIRKNYRRFLALVPYGYCYCALFSSPSASSIQSIQFSETSITGSSFRDESYRNMRQGLYKHPTGFPTLSFVQWWPSPPDLITWLEHVHINLAVLVVSAVPDTFNEGALDFILPFW